MLDQSQDKLTTLQRLNGGRPCLHHIRNWREYPGGKTCLYIYFLGAKALFCYENLHVNDSVGGKIIQYFSFGGIAPLFPCRYLPDLHESFF